MSSQEILIVGPEQSRTGGVSRYIAEQQRHLDTVTTTVYETGPASAATIRALLVGALLSIWRMVQFPLERRPDVMHVHSSFQHSFYRNAFYVLFGRYVWNCPVVLHVHGSSFDTFLQPDSRVVSWFQSVVLNATTRVVVLSSYWQSVLAAVVPEDRIVVVPNAVPTGEYDPEYPEMPHVVFLSNLIERKGITEFVAAVEAASDDPDVAPFQVTIAGSGPLADRVERLAAEHDHVTYLGYVDEAKKRALLSSGTIYALPTRAEGLPIAILEAMAAGMAIVSTPVGSIPEVVGEDNGLLVQPGDADALTEALVELLADPDRVDRMGRTNRAVAVADYSWEAAADRLTELYATVDDATPARATPVTAS
ncbi:Glycosyltransferase [Halapricum desulfuricans]|uniref:Glycosyltransferase n=1 Tax=Halapricum desulfuricans TaxID=2841257 RepID=A0A897N914_9EURY|nr:Glycosyltransferase [Halapricum desulfuricans]